MTDGTWVDVADSPTAHRLDNPQGYLTLDASGGVQHGTTSGGRQWWVDDTGNLRQGTVPAARVTGLPGSKPDSGLRNITTLLNLTSGTAFLHVTGGWVWMLLNNAVCGGTGSVVLTSSGLASVCPQAPIASAEGNLGSGTPPALRRVEVNRNGRARILGLASGEVLNGSITWPMTRPTPATWPGTPA